MVIDTGDGQIVATAAGDGTFAVPGVPTLQGTIKITASLHLPCNVRLVGGPLTVSELIPGGQTAVSLPQLVPDPGPPPPIIFAAAPVPVPDRAAGNSGTCESPPPYGCRRTIESGRRRSWRSAQTVVRRRSPQAWRTTASTARSRLSKVRSPSSVSRRKPVKSPKWS